jgi:serine/threonine protein kinase
MLPGTVIDGKYRINRVIGRGGMGVVVEATHVDLGELVALKFLQLKDEDVDGDFRSRFALEARVCAKLRNEHIARVHDVGVWEEKTPFMVMDYLEGIDLRRELAKLGRLPVLRAVDYAVQICQGLAEAHAQGIVHRDLKPANVFLTKRLDGTELVKVLDFGVSKWANVGDGLGELTKTGVMLGSPKYMAPEQLNGDTVDPRADIWSIGAILYTMLTGRPPYDFPQVTQTFMAIASGARPPVPSSLEPGIPAELDALILRCLTRDRNERFQTVAELAGAALEAIESPFASQVRAVLEDALGGDASGSARRSFLTLTTGSHTAFALPGESANLPATEPARSDRAGEPASSPWRRHRKAASFAAAGGAVALVAVLAIARSADGTTGAPGAVNAAAARERLFTAKTLTRENPTRVAESPSIFLPVPARAMAPLRDRTLEQPTRAQLPAAPAAAPQAPLATVAAAPSSAHTSGALDDRQ